MNKIGKIVIVAVLVIAVAVVIAIKQQGKNVVSEPVATANSNSDTATVGESGNPDSSQAAEDSEKLPHLIDLGAGKCIPCKMMKPILDDLKQNYNEQFKVTFIDVWENPGAGNEYGIKLIPTQIFYDASGKELFRHEGFYSKEDILGKWKELGIEL